MFTSKRLPAVQPPIEVRERRLDDVLHQLDVVGPVTTADVPAVARRIDAALAAGARWLIVDVADADSVPDALVAALVATARACRDRRGELVVSGASRHVTARLMAYDSAERPAMAASADQALMILKLLRPKTRVAPAGERARRRITSLTLPRVEPTPN